MSLDDRNKLKKEKKKYPSGYEYGKIINRGMIGIAYLARNVRIFSFFKPFVCIKKMFFAKIKEKKLETWVETEIKCHLKANDIEGCIHVQDIFSDKDSISLVLPYYIHGDLSKFIREHTRRKSIPQKESIVRPIFIKIAQALQRLHQKGGIVHRDLKLENILVDVTRLPDGSEVIDPVISDFGFAISREELLNDITTQRCMGTVNYFPFEMVTKVNRYYPDLGRFVQALSYDERCDIWTLGIML